MNLENMEFKPLKWYRFNTVWTTLNFENKVLFRVVNVYYSISKDKDGYDVRKKNNNNYPSKYIGEHINSLDAAKAVAQEDYEKLLTKLLFRRKKS